MCNCTYQESRFNYSLSCKAHPPEKYKIWCALWVYIYFNQRKDKKMTSSKIKSILLIASLILFSSTTVRADDTNNEVFNEEGIKSLEAAINKKPVVSENKTFNSNLLRSNPKGYPERKGIILVTKDKYKGLIPTGHAAIIYSPNTVIESLSKGVTQGKNNWYKSKTTCYGIMAKRASLNQSASAAEWCKNKIGKPYNYNYLNVKTRKKFYCSQLVWAAFKDKYKINMNRSEYGAAVHPLELVASSETMLLYRK